MSDDGIKIRVGDYVVPVMDVDGADTSYVMAVMTPCRVRNLYLNGKLFAASDDGSVTHHGAIKHFRRVDRGI